MARSVKKWVTKRGIQKQVTVEITTPLDVQKWLIDGFTAERNNFHRSIVARFSVDEAVGAITTPEQAHALKRASEICAPPTTWDRAQVAFAPGDFFDFPKGSFVPRNAVASYTYSEGNVARPEALARVHEELDFQYEALLPG